MNFELLFTTFVITTVAIRIIYTFASLLSGALDRINDPVKLTFANDLFIWIVTIWFTIIIYAIQVR